MRSDVFITCNVYAIASRFIYYAARPMSWAHAHHVHTMPPNVGYAALSTGIPSTNDNELKKCPAFMMLDMLIIVALSAIGYNHYWQPTFILAVIACAMRCIYYVRTRKSATYITGTSEYAQAWAAQVGNISRFFSLWYHHPLWLAQFMASAAAAYVIGQTFGHLCTYDCGRWWHLHAVRGRSHEIFRYICWCRKHLCFWWESQRPTDDHVSTSDEPSRMCRACSRT